MALVQLACLVFWYIKVAFKRKLCQYKLMW